VNIVNDEAPAPKSTSKNRHHAKPRKSGKKAKENKSKSIGHYLIGKTIGEGTFGKVKLGTHNVTGEKVAVKILEKHKIVEDVDVERVAREIKILKLARHPNIIQLYEIIETPR
jgi:5'-AMP-activated protein kinase catalytic alpha subunit